MALLPHLWSQVEPSDAPCEVNFIAGGQVGEVGAEKLFERTCAPLAVGAGRRRIQGQGDLFASSVLGRQSWLDERCRGAGAPLLVRSRALREFSSIRSPAGRRKLHFRTACAFLVFGRRVFGAFRRCSGYRSKMLTPLCIKRV